MHVLRAISVSIIASTKIFKKIKIFKKVSIFSGKSFKNFEVFTKHKISKIFKKSQNIKKRRTFQIFLGKVLKKLTNWGYFGVCSGFLGGVVVFCDASVAVFAASGAADICVRLY